MFCCIAQWHSGLNAEKSLKIVFLLSCAGILSHFQEITDGKTDLPKTSLHVAQCDSASQHGFQKQQTRSTLAFRAMPILNRGWWNHSSSKKGSSLSNVILTYSNRFHVVVHIVVAPQTFSLKWFHILRNTWQLSSRNGTTPVHRLSLELQLGSIDFMGAE